MLRNQAKNLANLPTSTLQQLQSNLQRTQTLLTQAQNITFDVNRIQLVQLLALHSQQLSDVIAVLSAKARADALEQARTVTTEAQGQAQYQLFSTRTGYVPTTVQMFSGH